MTASDSLPTFCPEGCYWECEHVDSPERRRLHAIQAEFVQALRRCRDCDALFYDAVAHGREHQHMRQLGWEPEVRPQGWRGWGRSLRAAPQ